MIRRELQAQIVDAAKQFPVIAILGPRQSGKTTLARHTFPHHRYVNLEDLSLRALAMTDPKGFLNDFPSEAGIILDEVQHVPALFSYTQVIADEQKKNGFFVFTGSQNLTLDANISQSLAGRIARFTLFPLSIHELSREGLLPAKIEELAFKGCFPKLYNEDVPVDRVHRNYIQTYVEQDVRQIKNVTNLVLFQKFMRACAARTGQLLNKASISEDLGISPSTVNEWLSLLVSSYIIFLLEPYYEKYGKRLVKTPKLYFVDTGIACHLLGLRDQQEVSVSYLRGSIIETCIISDLYRQFLNLDKDPDLYFWRDQTGHEVDAIVDRKPHPIAIEIKSSKTISQDYFDNVLFWNKITKSSNSGNYIIYGGLDSQRWPQASVLSWQSSGDLIQNEFEKRAPEHKK